MIETSVRKFQVTPSQYALFRFTVPQPTTLHIQMIATDPVNLLLLDNEERADYENGERTYTAAWGRRSDLETTIDDVDAGTWYLVVEGSTETSRGRIEVFQE